MTLRESRAWRLLKELRRRHVFGIAVAYGVVGFAVIEVADVVAPALQLPDWTVTLVLLLVALGFPIAIVLAWAFEITPEGIVRDRPYVGTEGESDAAPEYAGRAEPHSPPRPPAARTAIAVLPFANLSGGEENEYFSDGVTDDAIARISKIHALRVISRTSVMQYKHESKHLMEIGRDLGVGSILEGSVRRSGRRVRIVAQLVDVATDAHVWTETYDREMDDIFEIQTDVANRIATALEAELSPAEQSGIEKRPTQSVAAYDLYLKGRYEWNRRSEDGLRRSLEYFQRAIAVDDAFAGACAGLADSYATLGIYGLLPPVEAMPKARAAAERALEGDDSLAEAYATLGCVDAVYDWNWQSSESNFRRALECNPHYSTAHHWYAVNHLLPRGRFDEAQRELEAARELDPLSSVVKASFGLLSHLRGRNDEAIACYRKVLEVDAGFALAHYFLGHALTREKKYDQAIAAFEASIAAAGEYPEAEAGLALAFAMAGNADAARAGLAKLQAWSERRYVSPALFGQIYLGLGETERALDWLEKAYEDRSPELIWLAVRPTFDALASEPRFVALERAVGLTQ